MELKLMIPKDLFNHSPVPLLFHLLEELSEMDGGALKGL
jgi:hypothetical protein